MKSFFPLLLVLAGSAVAHADPTPPSWDENRRAGFFEHRRNERVFDREREKGRTAYLEELEKWERQRAAAIAEYKKRRHAQSPREGGPEDREDQTRRQSQARDMRKHEAEYIRQKQAMLKRGRQRSGLSDERELGLDTQRPRFEVSKRQLFGAPGAKGGSSFGGAGGGGGATPNFPPPPSYNEDFGGAGSGYIPPPPMSEYEDMPPPPPGVGVPFESGEGFPPPPPVPDFGDFPPPPPMPEMPEGF
ncbi:MAG: hypothetical protein KF802_01970 [Bdellovibrionaceae bacterium]|nr:hypothetical protein [Pseudobdellovibrionaceae bacterium]